MINIKVKYNGNNFEKALLKVADDLKTKFDSIISINYDLIRNNYVQFNSSFDTNFDEDTSNEEIETFVTNEYKNLFAKHLNTQTCFRTKFNTKFEPYAKVTIQ